MSPRGKVSEECKKRLRELEGQLSSIRSGRASIQDPQVLGFIVTSVRAMDEQCKELFRGIEPQIQSFRERYDPPAAGSIHESVARLMTMTGPQLFEMVPALEDAINHAAREVE